MDDSTVYYTSAYEKRIVKVLFLFCLINLVIVRAFSFSTIIAAAVLGLIHGYIIGMIMSYLVYGITCNKRNKHIINGIGTVIFGFLAMLDWRIEIYFAMFCSMLIFVPFAVFLNFKDYKADGDYADFSENDFDSTWFDFIHADISDFSVDFPIDIGTCKKDRLSGTIVAVGMGIKDKYQGMPVAKIRADNSMYLCPLERLIPTQIFKIRGSEVVASRQGKLGCEVTFSWYEYGGYSKIL